MNFDSFAAYFIILALATIVLILLWSAKHQRTMRDLKPIEYVSYKKEHFDKAFEFVCEYCGATVFTKHDGCPKCGAAYGKNKEYKLKKREINQKYLSYLQDQEEKIAQEIELIEKTKKALRKNLIWKSSTFNFEPGEVPVYVPASEHEFTCDYCDNKLRGKSTDEKGCPYCGALYKDNLDLLIKEEEDRVEECHYHEYLKLKDLEYSQNLKNERKDAHIERKYRKQIGFINKYAKYIALSIVLLIVILAVCIAVLSGNN